MAEWQMPMGEVGGWGGTLDLSYRDDPMEVKIKTPKKSPDQNLTPKKSHGKFPSLKNFQKAFNDET